MTAAQCDRYRPRRAQESYLPPEIVSLIVQEIRTGDASPNWKQDVATLSLVSSSFTDACQAELFRVVELKIPRAGLHNDSDTEPTPTSFPKLINDSPHLSAHIRDLTVTLTRPLSKDGEGAMLAEGLKQLKNVNRLSVRGPRICMSSFDFCCMSEPSALEDAIAALAEQPTLHSLELRELVIPVDVFANAKCHSVMIANCYFKTRGVRDLQVEHARSFKALTLDKSSVEHFLWDSFEPAPWNFTQAEWDTLNRVQTLDSSGEESELREADDQETLIELLVSPWFNYSGMEQLSIPIVLPEESKRRIQDYILCQPLGLKELHLTTTRPFFDDGYEDYVCPHTGREGWYRHWESPLASLNPQSYATLATLSFKIEFHLDAQHSDSFIRDPYHGIFCDGVFQGLHALENLAFEIWVGGCQWEDMDNSRSFAGDQWGELDRQLVPSGRPTAFPRLKSVGVVVGILEVKKWQEEARDVIWRLVDHQVFNRQYPGLKKLEASGLLKLALSTAETRGVEEDE